MDRVITMQLTTPVTIVMADGELISSIVVRESDTGQLLSASNSGRTKLERQ